MLSVPIDDSETEIFSEDASLTEVRIAFRVAEDSPEEHWLNRYAACLTATHIGYQSDDAQRNLTGYPYGKMCHTELIMQIQPGMWTRHSIYLGTYDPDTETIEPGHVHIKLVDDDEIFSKFSYGDAKKYEILKIRVNRKDQLEAMKFLVAQHGAGFNKNGYHYNIFPGFNFGTATYDENLKQEKRLWFCTELVTCALQAMILNSQSRLTPRRKTEDSDAREILKVKANKSSPNMLYRILKNKFHADDVIFRMPHQSKTMIKMGRY